MEGATAIETVEFDRWRPKEIPISKDLEIHLNAEENSWRKIGERNKSWVKKSEPQKLLRATESIILHMLLLCWVFHFVINLLCVFEV